MATTAKASLTSKRSTSSTLQPARFSAFCTAGTGAVVKRPGSWACAAWPATRATIFMPSFRATLSRVMTSAAAPETVTGVISRLKAPLSMAALALERLPMAYSSCASRVNW